MRDEQKQTPQDVCGEANDIMKTRLKSKARFKRRATAVPN